MAGNRVTMPTPGNPSGVRKGLGRGPAADKMRKGTETGDPFSTREAFFSTMEIMLPWNWSSISRISKTHDIPKPKAQPLEHGMPINNKIIYDGYEKRFKRGRRRTLKGLGLVGVASIALITFSTIVHHGTSGEAQTDDTTVDTEVIDDGPGVSFIDAPTGTLFPGATPSTSIGGETPIDTANTTAAATTTTAGQVAVAGDFSSYPIKDHTITPEDGPTPVSSTAAAFCPGILMPDLLTYIYEGQFIADNPGVNPDVVSDGQVLEFRDCPE